MVASSNLGREILNFDRQATRACSTGSAYSRASWQRASWNGKTLVGARGQSTVLLSLSFMVEFETLTFIFLGTILQGQAELKFIFYITYERQLQFFGLDTKRKMYQ
jgi:hypothetical protein